MKKLVCVALLLSMCFLFGCSSVDSKPSAIVAQLSRQKSKIFIMN